ncbi:hypothetical protein FRC03_006778, partial [Tulasnella sp. 419]
LLPLPDRFNIKRVVEFRCDKLLKIARNTPHNQGVIYQPFRHRNPLSSLTVPLQRAARTGRIRNAFVIAQREASSWAKKHAVTQPRNNPMTLQGSWLVKKRML